MIEKGDMYVDPSISGNTIWYAEKDFDGGEVSLIAKSGSDTWKTLFPLIKVEGNTEHAKELLKRQRLATLKDSLKEEPKDLKNELIKFLENFDY